MSPEANKDFDDDYQLPEPPPEEPSFDVPDPYDAGFSASANSFADDNFSQGSFAGNDSKYRKGKKGSRGKFNNPQAEQYAELRQPPHDREAEQGVLGAMLMSPNTVM